MLSWFKFGFLFLCAVSNTIIRDKGNISHSGVKVLNQKNFNHNTYRISCFPGVKQFVFCRRSDRILSVYDSRNMSEVLSTVESTVAPSTLIPFYDEDSSVVFLTAKVR